MKSMTFPHLMGYLAAASLGAIVWLSNLDPANLAFLGPNAVKWATAGVGLAGAILLFLHQTGWIPSKPADKVSTVAKALIPLMLLLPLLHGCATFQKLTTAISSPAAQPFIQAGAQVAVTTAEARGISSAQIIGIAQKALQADSGTAATLATVGAAINAELTKLNLPAGDIAAASILEASFSLYIQQQLGNNATVAQTQAAVADVLNAIITAAGGLQSVPATITSIPSAPTTQTVPAQNRHFVLSSVESPELVGASASLVLIACLQAFAHLSVNAPVGAAITVLFTVSAAAIDNLIS